MFYRKYAGLESSESQTAEKDCNLIFFLDDTRTLKDGIEYRGVRAFENVFKSSPTCLAYYMPEEGKNLADETDFKLSDFKNVLLFVDLNWENGIRRPGPFGLGSGEAVKFNRENAINELMNWLYSQKSESLHNAEIRVIMITEFLGYREFECEINEMRKLLKKSFNEKGCEDDLHIAKHVICYPYGYFEREFYDLWLKCDKTFKSMNKDKCEWFKGREECGTANQTQDEKLQIM